MRNVTLALLSVFALPVADASLATEVTKQPQAKTPQLDQLDATGSQKGSTPTVQVDDVVLYQQDFNGGAAGWTTLSIQDGGGGIFWHQTPFEGDGVMECNVENSCFVASPGYGNDWTQDVTKTFSVSQVVTSLIGTVDALVAQGALPAGTANGLKAKLNAALAALAQGKTNVARNKLQDFITQVNGLVPGQLSPANAALLTGPAQNMVALLDSPPTTLTLDYLLQIETEPGFDFVSVQASGDGGTTFDTLDTIDGSSGGAFQVRSADLTPYLTNPPNVVVRFRFTSDGSYSDEDGFFLSGGAACRLDDVAVTGFGTDDFETGTNGWTASTTTPLDAAFRLELNPPQDFPPTPPAGLTGLSWVAFDPVSGILPFSEPEARLDVAIESPPIPIPAATSYFLEFDIYSDQAPFQQTGVAINWDVAAADALPCLLFTHSFNFNTTANGTFRRRFNITNFVEPGATSVVLRLRATDFFALTGNPNPPSRHGRGPYFDNVSLLAQGVTLKAAAETPPQTFALAQNHPNPFNPTTTIRFTLPTASDYSLAVYDVTGRMVRQYAGSADPGEVSVIWDGTDAAGGRVGSGLYFYRVQAGRFTEMKRMVLLK